MIEKKVVVGLPHGLHARPAASFVKLATNFKSDIKLVKNGKEANGKSIMGVMASAIAKGDEITLVANGMDEADAIAALEKVLQEEE